MIRFDLRAEMRALRLSISDLVILTGRSRITVWRWCRAGRVPSYLLTILKARRVASQIPTTESESPSPSSGRTDP